MTDIPGMTSILPGSGQATVRPNVTQPAGAGNINLEFEKLLWAEMLSHAGLEKAFTQSGGEAAASFSRMIVESIAEDLAERHPLGFDPVGTRSPQGGPAAAGGEDQ